VNLEKPAKGLSNLVMGMQEEIGKERVKKDCKQRREGGGTMERVRRYRQLLGVGLMNFIVLAAFSLCSCLHRTFL
jgi:hypothetical protein